MVGSRHLGNVLINKTECVALRDDVLYATYNGFSYLEIKWDSIVIIDCYNKKKVVCLVQLLY